MLKSEFRAKYGYDNPQKSWRKDKKMVVLVRDSGSDRLVHFGARGMSDYTKHHDKARRQRYLARSKGIVDASGTPTYNKKNKRELLGAQGPVVTRLEISVFFCDLLGDRLSERLSDARCSGHRLHDDVLLVDSETDAQDIEN